MMKNLSSFLLLWVGALEKIAGSEMIQKIYNSTSIYLRLCFPDDPGIQPSDITATVTVQDHWSTVPVQNYEIVKNSSEKGELWMKLSPQSLNFPFLYFPRMVVLHDIYVYDESSMSSSETLFEIIPTPSIDVATLIVSSNDSEDMIISMKGKYLQECKAAALYFQPELEAGVDYLDHSQYPLEKDEITLKIKDKNFLFYFESDEGVVVTGLDCGFGRVNLTQPIRVSEKDTAELTFSDSPLLSPNSEHQALVTYKYNQSRGQVTNYIYHIFYRIQEQLLFFTQCYRYFLYQLRQKFRNFLTSIQQIFC